MPVPVSPKQHAHPLSTPTSHIDRDLMAQNCPTQNHLGTPISSSPPRSRRKRGIPSRASLPRALPAFACRTSISLSARTAGVLSSHTRSPRSATIPGVAFAKKKDMFEHPLGLATPTRPIGDTYSSDSRDRGRVPRCSSKQRFLHPLKAITTGRHPDVCLSLLDSKALAQLDQTTFVVLLHPPRPPFFDFASEMPITSAQKAAIEEIINVLVSTTPARGKRQLSALFMELVDRADWPEYYEVLYSIFTSFSDKHSTYIHTHIHQRPFFILGHSRTAVYQWRESQRGEKPVQGPNERVYRPFPRVLERLVLQ